MLPFRGGVNLKDYGSHAALFGGAAEIFWERYLVPQPLNRVAIYRLNDAGATMSDSSGNSFDGTYTSVTVQGATGPDGNLTAVWDGINDVGAYYSAPLAAVFNGAEFTCVAWMQVANAGVWTDAAIRAVYSGASNASNEILLTKTATNNQFSWLREGGGIPENVVDATFAGSTAWHQVAITVSEGGDVMRAFLDGAQTDIDQINLGVYVGALNSIRASIGASNTVPAQVWAGALAILGIWNAALTPSEIAALYWTPVV